MGVSTDMHACMRMLAWVRGSMNMFKPCTGEAPQLSTPMHLPAGVRSPTHAATPPDASWRACARQLDLGQPLHRSAHAEQSFLQSPATLESLQAVQDTPYWKKQRPGPGAFTEPWKGSLDSVALRNGTLHSAPLPAEVYEPTLGTSAIAPASFVDTVSSQIIARVLAALPAHTALPPALQPAAPTSGAVPMPMRQPLQLQPQPQATQAQQVLPLAGGQLPTVPLGLLTAVPQCSVPEPAAPARNVLPKLASIDSLDKLFAWWYDGQGGDPPVSSLPVEARSAKNVKQRYSEWSKFFGAVQVQLDAGQSRAQALAAMKAEMQQLSAAQASQAKKRKATMSVAGFFAVKIGKRS